MPDTPAADGLHGRTLVDPEGERIGRIEELYYDEKGGQPEWAMVTTGLFGSRKTLVPIGTATPSGEDLMVPATKQQVKNAPPIEIDRELSAQEERALFEYYGVRSGDDAGSPGRDDIGGPAGGRPRLRRYVTAAQVRPEHDLSDS